MATTKKSADDKPFDGSLAAFIKEAKESDVKPYRLDVGKGKRITFKAPDEIGTQEFITVFGGGLDGLTDEKAITFFLDSTLSPDDKAILLEANPPLRVTMSIMDAVREHYEAQVPTPGESSASSD